MAIPPSESPSAAAAPVQPAQPIDIESWTEQATAALSTVTISAPGDIHSTTTTTTTTTMSLEIPLDDVTTPSKTRPAGASAAAKEGGYYKRKAPVRRDSLNRREALLKGKEGSKRRMRWENDRLLNNPYAEPPLPQDWDVRPTHPVHNNVPYYLAPLWDAGLKRQATDRKKASLKAQAASKTVAKKPTNPGIVPKELREKLKKSRGARGLLMDLEGEVRRWVVELEEREKREAREVEDGVLVDGHGGDDDDASDSSDEEIVFVGRNGRMSDVPTSPTSSSSSSSSSTANSQQQQQQLKRELMLFETPEEDVGGTFGRWLVHHIGVYYGLRTWSVTVGNPARREAYVGLKGGSGSVMRTGGGGGLTGCGLPRPLYGLV